MRFRNDINALRGVAVTLVALFHFGVPGFVGGFIGVDVFFVISGYLMTAIIVSRLDQSRFNLWEFYLARFTRIVPALAALAAALLAFGWLYLDPREYKLLAEHAGASLTFISNFVYWREAGYFDTSSQGKWLLHTWSLSAEWQFYVVYPIILAGAARLFGNRRRVYQSVLVVLGVGSLLLAPIVVRNHPEANFFLLPTRAWEMVVGGMVMLNAGRLESVKRHAGMLQTVGLVAILAAGLLFTDALDWPGAMTLVPVLGAALVILVDTDATWFSRSRVLHLLGRWSYSIYLWHWPVTVLIRYLDLPSPSWVVTPLGLAISVLAGFISYELIERRAAGLRGRFGMRSVAALAMGPIALVLACGVLTLANGAPARLSPRIKLVSAESSDVDPRRTECLTNSVQRLGAAGDGVGCKYGSGTAPVGAIVWGDSHGNAVITSVAAAAAQHDDSVMFFGTSGCPPFLGASRFGKHTEAPCRAFAKRVEEDLSHYPSQVPLLMVARFSAYVDGKNDSADPTILIGYDGQRPLADPAERRSRYAQYLVSDLCALAKTRPVYVLLPIPEMNHDVPNYLARSMILGRTTEDVSVSLTAYNARNAVARGAIEQAASACGVKTLDPVPYLCRDGRCFGSAALMPLYIDGDHLSRRGSALLQPLFGSIFSAHATVAP
jgi:peptidoglycan/LPS O-acetylase OafA/YrhL